jgi:hypothetical protein
MKSRASDAGKAGLLMREKLVSRCGKNWLADAGKNWLADVGKIDRGFARSIQAVRRM